MSITIDNINEKVKDMQYAVRGAIVAKAGEIEAALKADPSQFPFEKVVYCNIGNPQSLGQKPITFYRQVLALCDYPEVRLAGSASPRPRKSSPPRTPRPPPPPYVLRIVRVTRLAPPHASPRPKHRRSPFVRSIS